MAHATDFLADMNEDFLKELTMDLDEVDFDIFPLKDNVIRSQSSKTGVDNSNLKSYIKAQKNPNTLRKTDAEASKFINWVKESPRNVKTDIEQIQPAVLDNLIGNYLIVVAKKNGQPYEPDTLTSIHRAIDRYLRDAGYPYSIVRSQEFDTSRQVLQSRRKELKEMGFGNRTNKAETLTPEDEDKLWEKGQLGNQDPVILQRTIWFLTTKLMGKF